MHRSNVGQYMLVVVNVLLPHNITKNFYYNRTLCEYNKQVFFSYWVLLLIIIFEDCINTSCRAYCIRYNERSTILWGVPHRGNFEEWRFVIRLSITSFLNCENILSSAKTWWQVFVYLNGKNPGVAIKNEVMHIFFLPNNSSP